MVKIPLSVHISRRKDEPYALFGWGDLTGAIPFRLTRFTRCSLSFMLHGQWHLSGSTPSPVRTTCVVHVFQGGKHDIRHSVAGLRLRVHTTDSQFPFIVRPSARVSSPLVRRLDVDQRES